MGGLRPAGCSYGDTGTCSPTVVHLSPLRQPPTSFLGGGGVGGSRRRKRKEGQGKSKWEDPLIGGGAPNRWRRCASLPPKHGPRWQSQLRRDGHSRRGWRPAEAKATAPRTAVITITAGRRPLPRTVVGRQRARTRAAEATGLAGRDRWAAALNRIDGGSGDELHRAVALATPSVVRGRTHPLR